MKAREEPVALWKGIAGTAISGFALLLTFLVFLFWYLLNKVLPDWAVIIIFVAFLVCLFSLVISINNIREAVEYKKTIEDLERVRLEKVRLEKEGATKSEILHKLLSEGKITIEEYDELNK